MPSFSEHSAISRLKQRRDFLACASAGRKWATPGMVVQVRERPGQQPSDALIRVGFTTSKKVGNAVVRNRVRRRLRALADQIIPGNTKPGVDIVLIGRASTAKRSFDALERDLKKCLHKLDALVAPQIESKKHAG
jgi:ribonuclease P protein component